MFQNKTRFNLGPLSQEQTAILQHYIYYHYTQPCTH